MNDMTDETQRQWDAENPPAEFDHRLSSEVNGDDTADSMTVRYE